MRILEFFAGVGGLAAALESMSITANIVAAIDIDTDARATYQLNWDHPFFVREIETLPPQWLGRLGADLWWMSPPCTPFTQRGMRRDIHDPRCRALLHLIDVVSQCRPAVVCIENVVGFESSECYRQLQRTWKEAGYHVRHEMLCPSQLGWPNRRPRIYCIARLDPRPFEPILPLEQRVRWCELVDDSIVPSSHPELWLEAELQLKYESALDVLEYDDPDALTACFGASYGRSITRSGSYLRTSSQALRRFAPHEVARLLGFPDTFQFPSNIGTKRRWHLLGNSLSIPAVQSVLARANIY